MTKECSNTNDQKKPPRHWSLNIGHSLGLGHWSLLISCWSLAIGRSLGLGHCSLVIRHWSFFGYWSLVIGHLLTGCAPERPQLNSQLFSEVQIIGSRGTAPGQFNKPRSVALDKNDNLFVVDMTGRVQKFSPDGAFISSWQMPETDKGKPKGMCRDSEGNIVVIEPHYSRVNYFTPGGQLVAQWMMCGMNPVQL